MCSVQTCLRFKLGDMSPSPPAAACHHHAKTLRQPTRIVGLRWQAQRDTAFGRPNNPAYLTPSLDIGRGNRPPSLPSPMASKQSNPSNQNHWVFPRIKPNQTSLKNDTAICRAPTARVHTSPGQRPGSPPEGPSPEGRPTPPIVLLSRQKPLQSCLIKAHQGKR